MRKCCLQQLVPVDRSKIRLVSSGGIPTNSDQTEPSGSDLTKGIEIELLADGAMLLGHVGKDQVMLARSGDEVVLEAFSRREMSHGGRILTRGNRSASSTGSLLKDRARLQHVT
jgi:hypothetical protein